MEINISGVGKRGHNSHGTGTFGKSQQYVHAHTIHRHLTKHELVLSNGFLHKNNWNDR